MKKVLYIPGLGGQKSLNLQQEAIDFFTDKQLLIEMFDTSWHTDESAEEKYQRLRVQFEKLEPTTVIAASAGGSLAMRLFGENKAMIEHVYLLSSKFQKPELIGLPFQKRAPAILESVQRSEKAFKKLAPEDCKKITTYTPLFDQVIRVDEMKIDGATNKKVWAIGHVFGIASALIKVLRAIKK